jgi:hypothetical protein
MSNQCISIRGKSQTTERCPYKAKVGESWCGHHIKQQNRVTFQQQPPTPQKNKNPLDPSNAASAVKVAATWRRYIARRSGPLLWFRGESNNPTDFYTTEPVEEIPLHSFISFVDESGKGYIMDIASAVALALHANAAGEEPLNPFNRAPLPTTFLRRILRHKPAKATDSMPSASPSTVTIDLFRIMEDLGYYTDPTWFNELRYVDLVRFYIELAHIWYTSAGLTVTDHIRIVPIQTRLFTVPVRVIGNLGPVALKQTVLDNCKLFVSSAAARSDRQLGAMYVLGALSLFHRGARQAYSWMYESVAPGVTRDGGEGRIAIIHPAALHY